MTDPRALDEFRAARRRVLHDIERACARAGRDPAVVTVVAVSKTVPAERAQAAVDAGFALLGENRVQEAASKAPLVHGASWHLVGPLQSNKARRAVELFAAIESVDSIDLARRLDRLAGEAVGAPEPDGDARGAAERIGARRLPIYLQVNVDLDPAKAGFRPDEIAAVLPELASMPHVEIAGLMTVGRLVATPDEARPTFAALRELSERLRSGEPALGAGLSMGMSDDYAVAVEEGATLVRIGRAIFGARPAPPG